MLNRWKKTIDRLLYRGAKQCVQFMPGAVLRFRPFGVYEILLADGRQDATLGEANDSKLQVRWVDDRQQLDQLEGLADPKNLRDWDGSTRRVAVACMDGQPVGVAWIATGSFAEPELGVSYRLQADEAWLYAAVVDSQHRRRGYYTALLSFVLDELANEGMARLLLGVSAGNEASLRSHLRMGAMQLGSIFAAKSLGFVYCKTRGRVSRTSQPAVVWRRTVEVAVGR